MRVLHEPEPRGRDQGGYCGRREQFRHGARKRAWSWCARSTPSWDWCPGLLLAPWLVRRSRGGGGPPGQDRQRSTGISTAMHISGHCGQQLGRHGVHRGERRPRKSWAPAPTTRRLFWPKGRGGRERSTACPRMAAAETADTDAANGDVPL